MQIQGSRPQSQNIITYQKGDGRLTFIDLKELKHYIGCNQYNIFFYNTVNEKICNIGDIVSALSVSKKEFIENCFYYDYIPLPSLNISDAFDNFISSLNNKKLSMHFRDVDKNNILEYWLQFDEFFHVGFERRLWNEYYADYVHKKAITWCDEYCIRYR